MTTPTVQPMAKAVAVAKAAAPAATAAPITATAAPAPIVSLDRILIQQVRVAGFRGISDLELNLSRMTVLLGVNNSGKTSVLKALQLALGDYQRYLSEEDFYINDKQQRAKEIVVDIKIIPLDDKGSPTASFDDNWTIEFGDKIQSSANGEQFLAIRTRAKANPVKGGFEIIRYALPTWPESSKWQEEKPKDKDKISRFESLTFYSVEAQRDIHHELKEKNSFIGRVLSKIEYDKQAIDELEAAIKAVNENAVGKSQELTNLKKHLNQLSRSFQGFGNTEITPFPKKIRDLAKHFSVHFGNSPDNSFSMEYHGMGTRSWASMLTVQSFIDLNCAKHVEEAQAFFPILAAEEPEAHLHPNAQKTLYQQLSDSKGQVIISTHSPYFAAMADTSYLRCLSNNVGIVSSKQLSLTDKEEIRRLRREILHSRGELLFSRAIVLCEGETEEQALPMLFNTYFGASPFVMGVNFVGVGGSGKYLPFLKFSKDFEIPIFIFSDGETQTVSGLNKTYNTVFPGTDVTKSPSIVILGNSDFEDYLINNGFKKHVEEVIKEEKGDTYITDWIAKFDGTPLPPQKSPKPPCPACKQPIYEGALRNYTAEGGYELALCEILSKEKTKYASLLGEKLSALKPTELPPKVIELFDKIKGVLA